ncbi:MAG: YigZ family protein [Bacteroidota bacterium]
MELSTDSFRSISGESRGIYREKASKFIAVALPVSSEDEVKASLEELRKSYHDANHHCYAYRLGLENQAYRVHDDGEPSGSAGKPIYGQILSTGLSDVLVVVIRYFGGTKLGIPGLIHAYRIAAREALDQAEIIEKVIRVPLKVIFEYPMMNEIMRILKEEGVKIISQSSAINCEIDFQVRKSNLEKVRTRLTRLNKVEIISF